MIARVLLGGRGILILQTMTEFHSVATRKFRIPARDAPLFLDKLRAVLSVHAADERDFDRATKGDGHGFSLWDALLWATADRLRVRYLLSEDFHDGRTLGGVTFVDPLKGENAHLLARSCRRHERASGSLSLRRAAAGSADERS